MFHVYIIQNPSNNYYIGHTNNIERRLIEHNTTNNGSQKYTKNKGPWKIVYLEKFDNRFGAMRREKEIKNKKSKKYIEYLINRVLA